MKVPGISRLVFDDTTMRSRLPRETYEALKRTINQGRSLDINVANVVANAMKNWAVGAGLRTIPTGSSP